MTTPNLFVPKDAVAIVFNLQDCCLSSVRKYQLLARSRIVVLRIHRVESRPGSAFDVENSIPPLGGNVKRDRELDMYVHSGGIGGRCGVGDGRGGGGVRGAGGVREGGGPVLV